MKALSSINPENFKSFVNGGNDKNDVIKQMRVKFKIIHCRDLVPQPNRKSNPYVKFEVHPNNQTNQSTNKLCIRIVIAVAQKILFAG